MKDKIIALLLAFVMAFTAVPTALAADDDGHKHNDVEWCDNKPIDGQIEVNEEEGALEWVLDHFGTLHIGGYGKIKPFTSPDDQPWKDYRDRIFDVDIHFDEIEIENTVYWFDGCAFVQQAVNTMSLMSVSGSVPLLAAGSGSHDCGITSCTCTGKCTWGYTNYTAVNSTTHDMVPYCIQCGKLAGIYTSGSHTFRGNTCSLCGCTKSCSHPSTRTEYITNCSWQKVCTSCGEVISSGTSHGPYTYGSWSYDNASTHSRSYTCSHGDSGTYYESGYHNATPSYSQYSASQHSVSSYCYTCSHSVGSTTYENHSFTYGSWQNYSASQHRRALTCSKCGYTDYEYASHSVSYGSWTSKSSTQHQRTKTCSCGYSGTETASHSFTYGSWACVDETQHRRTKSCACGYSDFDYADHHDEGDDGFCDECGYEMTRFSVTVPASLSLTVSKTGAVYAAENAAIVNNSTAAIKVTGVTVSAANGWTLVPYATNMASAKVDSKKIGFTVNDAATTKTGTSEALSLGGGWSVAKGASLPLSYHAVVSATSEVIQLQQVLTLVFVVDWA